VERFLESEALSLELNKCNSYQRRLIYQTAKEKYPSLRHAQNILLLAVELHLFRKDVTDVADPDPGSGAFLTSGSGIQDG
jgi:hypothetical protein